MIIFPKLDSPSGFVGLVSPKDAWDEFAEKYPKVDISDPLHEGNGLWIAKWLSPGGKWQEYSARGNEGLRFFLTLHVIMAEEFPNEPPAESTEVD